MTGDIVLEARKLEKRFGAVVAASDISIKLARGSRLSVIGANGAGKTTFVNMVTGYLKPDSGEILLEGRPITKSSPRAMTRQGVCRSFQIPQLCESMTPLENALVAIGAAGGRESFFRPASDPSLIARARDILTRFKLEDYAERKVSELPGGIRKLIDIAMAMVRQPKLLLLDEPTSGVSADEKFALMDTVEKAMEGTDVTVLFVEHDMDIVTRYADRVLAFYAGRVIADDAPDEVLADLEVQRYVTGTAR